MRSVAALLVALLVALCAPAAAQRDARAPIHGPAARAIVRSAAPRATRTRATSTSLSRVPQHATVAPHEPISSARAANGRGFVARVHGGEEAFHGAEVSKRAARGSGFASRFASVVRGVRQTLRPFRARGSGALRSRISQRAAARHPALVTALRGFPDAVVVGREDVDGTNGYLLHGPTVTGPSGRREFLRVRVSRVGRVETSIVDAETGRVAEGTAPSLASRDWHRHPAVVRVNQMPSRLYALSDVHGSVGQMTRMLSRWGVVANESGEPTWTAGNATLVVVGDVINKTQGGSLPAIDYLRALERAAEHAGGRVIVTMGNHESALLGDTAGMLTNRPTNIGPELVASGTRVEDVARGRDAEGRGEWLRTRPLAARVGSMLFVHSGDTGGESLDTIEARARVGVDRDDYRNRTLAGRESDRRAPLDSEGWETRRRVTRNLENAEPNGPEVRGVVYGHNNEALGRRTVGGVATGYRGRLTNVDTAMRESGNDAAMLVIETDQGRMRARALFVDGRESALWDRRAH